MLNPESSFLHAEVADPALSGAAENLTGGALAMVSLLDSSGYDTDDYDVGSFDADSDGHDDTLTLTGDNEVLVFSDVDGDGTAEHLVRIDDEGNFGSWEAHSSPDVAGRQVWTQTEQGRLGS